MLCSVKVKDQSHWFYSVLSALVLIGWYHIPGQGSSLHERVATPLPSQSFPPLEGGGLEQVLLRLWIPPPQVTGHFSQAFQSVQFPSTTFLKKTKERKKAIFTAVHLIIIYWVRVLFFCVCFSNSWGREISRNNRYENFPLIIFRILHSSLKSLIPSHVGHARFIILLLLLAYSFLGKYCEAL